MKFEFIYIFSLVLDSIVNLSKKLLGTHLIWGCTDFCWYDYADAANNFCQFNTLEIKLSRKRKISFLLSKYTVFK